MSYVPGSQQAQHYHAGAPAPVDERYVYGAPVGRPVAGDGAGYAPNMGGGYPGDAYPSGVAAHGYHAQQPTVSHPLSSLQQRQQLAVVPPPPLNTTHHHHQQQQQSYYDSVYGGQYQVSGADMGGGGGYPVSPPAPHSAPPLQAVHPSQQGHYSAQGHPHAEGAGQYPGQAASAYCAPPPATHPQQVHFGQAYQPAPQSQQYGYGGAPLAPASEAYAYGQPQYPQQPPPPLVHAHTMGSYNGPPRSQALHRADYAANDPAGYQQAAPAPAPAQQYYAPPPQHQPPPPQHQPPPPQHQPPPPQHQSPPQQYQQPPPQHLPPPQQHQRPSQQHQQPPQQQAAVPGGAVGGYGYSQADAGYYGQEPVQAAPSPLYQSPYQQQQQQHQQLRQQQMHQQQINQQQINQQQINQQQIHHQQQTYQQQPGAPYAQPPPPASQAHEHYAAPAAAHAPPPPGSRYRAQVPSPEPHAPRPADSQQQQRLSQQRPSQQQAGGVPGSRLSYAEHSPQYIAGHPPISSVMTAEPLMAPSAAQSSASIQRKSTLPDPRASYTGSPHAPDSASIASAQGRRRESADYQDRQRDAAHGNTMHGGTMAALASSMGSLSVAPPGQYPPQQQQQHQQFSQSAAPGQHPPQHPPQQQLISQSATVLTGSAMSVPSTLVASATFGGADHAKSSTPTFAQPGANIAYPLWHNIDANAFHAYRHHIAVQRSNLTGSKYALVIGINYYEMEYSQSSNINSAHVLKTLLVSKYGYAEKNVTLLSDDLKDKRFHPTHQLITKHITRMMAAVRPNDSVFFYFCGFGRLPSQLQDKRSEVLSSIRRLRADYILPVDFEQCGPIDASYLHHHMVHRLPASARLTALFNCIVNETGLGVPYKYTTNGTAVLTNAIAGSNLFEAGAKMAQQNVTGSFGDLSQRFETSMLQQQQQQQPAQPAAGHAAAAADEEVVRLKQSSGDIVVFGWDRDYSTPKYKKFLAQTPSNHLGSYWAAAMEGALRSKSTVTFGEIILYLQGASRDLVMMPFVASGRKIGMDEEFII